MDDTGYGRELYNNDWREIDFPDPDPDDEYGFDLFQEVTLYGALIHVVTDDPVAHRPLIQRALEDAGVTVGAIDRIPPSLEDVFIATARRNAST